MLRINDKFGTGMTVNILLGKSSKVKEYMCKFEEYGTGLSFGDENWWKEFIRVLINNDYLIETQVKGSFGTTLSLTNKGRTAKNKLVNQYPKYLNLLQAIEDFNEESDNETSSINSNSNSYSKFKVMFEPIKTETKKKTTRVRKTTNTSSTSKTNTIKIIENANLNKTSYANSINDMPTTFLKYKLDDIDSLNDELEKELAELDVGEDNITKKIGRKKIIVAE